MFFLFLFTASLLSFEETTNRFIKKISSYSNFGDAIETRVRPFLIIEGSRVVKEHLIAGVGVHNSQYYLYTPRYYRLVELGRLSEDATGVYSHNNYIEMGLNAGILAIILFYTPIFFILCKTYRLKQLNPHMNNIKIYIVLTLCLKLFFDIWMVSYNSFIHIFVTTICFVLYYRNLHLKKRNNCSNSSI